MEAKLIIRAPSQNIEDQVIICNMDWTISRLKIHLSEVYPNKPVVQEQKLIYSGRLLHDHLQLKDIIRHEDMQSSVHILHLVWNGKFCPSSYERVPSSSQAWPNQSTSLESSDTREENVEISENILRHRTNIPSQRNDSQIQFQQMPVDTLPAYPSDPQMIAQMAAMQQMYAQYMSQYFQNMSGVGVAGNVPFIPVVSNIQTLQNNTNNPTHESAQQPANPRNNIPAVQIEENEFVNRDWLDQFFYYFRFLILLCIVYFYTTPERFMLVIIVVVVAFLYHEGWFVRQGIAEAVMGQRNRAQFEPNPNVVNNANDRLPSNENDGQDAHELEATMDGEDPPHAQNPDAANNNNQVFSPLTFLATFFSSLIPETPPPVNIN